MYDYDPYVLRSVNERFSWVAGEGTGEAGVRTPRRRQHGTRPGEAPERLPDGPND
jgi:hypothetical protein